MTKQKIAVMGCGLWGRNIVRNFYNLEVLDTVCDLDEENLAKVKEQYPNVKTTKPLSHAIKPIVHSKSETTFCYWEIGENFRNYRIFVEYFVHMGVFVSVCLCKNKDNKKLPF